MRKILISGTAALLCAAAIPAIAAPASQDSSQTGAQSDRSSQQPRARDPNRRVCVSAQLSDSRMRRRICRTQAEWDSLQANDNDGQGINR
jgi:hypothetical protein